jgi:hypothetical protein
MTVQLIKRQDYDEDYDEDYDDDSPTITTTDEWGEETPTSEEEDITPTDAPTPTSYEEGDDGNSKCYYDLLSVQLLYYAFTY